MPYSGLNDFIEVLEEKGELQRIKTFVDPILEITEVTERVSKAGGKALLYENTGTDFPLLINIYASDKRMSLAIGRNKIDETGNEIEDLFRLISRSQERGLIRKMKGLPRILKLLQYLPHRTYGKGKCQQVIHTDPDLGILPVLKCWPHDGGRFITLPMVHTRHPVTGNTNVGMYRMQVLDGKTTGMHWHKHKTGANHYEAWKQYGKIMPVAVALGGDPAYAYSAIAPLPENIDEYILAGILRKKRVSLVKCITQDLYVPSDADIIIEGYVDPNEDLVWEGPFGDHTGFYSLADWYPKFHITCLTHTKKAVYPATIVGVPPQEDAWISKATERIFLTPIKLTLQPEIEDLHMPDAGVAHNLIIVRINKNYSGQGMKVINSLFGAGQMMFAKYIVAVSGDINIRNYKEVAKEVFKNTDFKRDVLFNRGPLDILDHSSDTFSFGGKMGIDATVKTTDEKAGSIKGNNGFQSDFTDIRNLLESKLIETFNINLACLEMPLLFIGINKQKQPEIMNELPGHLLGIQAANLFRLIIAVDSNVDINNYHTIAWQALGNSDPVRDHSFITEKCLFIDGTNKWDFSVKFPREWPNIVSSGTETIEAIDKKWESLGIGKFIESPSLKLKKLNRAGGASVK
jgi:4-hydroxy-3-polyprenylbenzoate decarboxylase